MREIRTSGSEGGVELILHSYPYPNMDQSGRDILTNYSF